ncbi:uncharacterized protein BDZ99DRAFT_24206 [Mytilinidion resinicola]|uniref:Uncharacterized protein n=1 Tax=Mytilinidion resinicola TaxID=574789 RepID=A0A6A6ZAD6_9PEZI|nr:uncharacterized protein BDZ99DRAFT_24206 [Mytilinidion resinicola]KAF2817798.1 hypothetical protein BDZ99DRAFT_24206 [Mytilinidion resinicola]
MMAHGSGVVCTLTSLRAPPPFTRGLFPTNLVALTPANKDTTTQGVKQSALEVVYKNDDSTVWIFITASLIKSSLEKSIGKFSSPARIWLAAWSFNLWRMVQSLYTHACGAQVYTVE